MKRLASWASCHARPAVLQRGCQRAHPGIAALLVISVLNACAGRALPPQTATPAEIVVQNASDAFATFLDPIADRASMQSFATSIATATSRQDLTLAWNQVPSLATKGTSFLQDHVFSKSIAEAKWPRDKTPEQMEPSFVQGMRTAVATFLAGGQ